MDTPTNDSEIRSEISDIKIDLTIDETGHLSAEPEDIDDDNAGIADLNVRDCYVTLRFEAAQFGTFRSKQSSLARNASLVIVKATFHPAAAGARFKYARVEFRFAAPPHISSDDGALAPPSAPRIALMAPHLSYGDPTLMEHGVAYRFAVFAPSPGGQAGLPSAFAGISNTKSYTTQERMVVQGSILKNPSRAIWSVHEKSTKEGILREATFAMIVYCDDPIHGFVMTTKIEAEVSKRMISGKDIARMLAGGKVEKTRVLIRQRESEILVTPGLSFGSAAIAEFERIDFEARYERATDTGNLGMDLSPVLEGVNY